MKEQRKKILEMLSEGTITPEEAEELLDTLQFDETEKANFSKKMKDEIQKAKTEILKAKDYLKKNIDQLEIKEKAKIGLDKVDAALKDAEEELKAFGRKVKKVFTEEEE